MADISISNGESGSSVRSKLNVTLGSVYNVKHYGAVGDGVNDDSGAIESALAAMYGNGFKGGIVFFPAGTYKVTRTIDIAHPNPASSNNTNACIIGAGRFSTYITGLLNNGFIFSQADNTNGPEEIAHLSIVNTSTWIGSGGLMLNNSSAHIHDCHFGGMICVLLPFNIFNAIFQSCNGEANSDGTTGYNGTLGIAGYAPHVWAWRGTSPFQACLQLWGANSNSVIGCGIENSVTAALLGVGTGWASHCTVSGDTLTVGGTLGSGISLQFGVGFELFGRGIPIPAWADDPGASTGATTIIANLTGAGFAGTYQLSANLGTISTPIPIWSRFTGASNLSLCSLHSLQTEACYYAVYANNITACTIANAGGGINGLQCGDQFGSGGGNVGKAGIYIRNAGATTFSGISPGGVYTRGAVAFKSDATITNSSFISCHPEKKVNNFTNYSPTISNRSE